MKYQQKSFNVTTSGYTTARQQCEQFGHMDTDVRGKCLRCGEPVSAESQQFRRAMRGEVPWPRPFEIIVR